MKPLSIIKLLLAAAALACPGGTLAQSTGVNHILTSTLLDSTGTASLDQIDYFDGLGRPVQTLIKKASPRQLDIVTTREYDPVGREAKAWLPVPVGGTGAYIDTAEVKAASNSFYTDARAHEEPVYEQSPMNRVKERHGPGSAWHTAGKPVKTAWMVNTSQGELSCAMYAVASDTSIKKTGMYAGGVLFVTRTADEDGNVSYTFTDKQGQVLLERVMNGSATNDTYRVHDDLGNLRYVLTPAAADALAATTTWDDTHPALKDHAYIYKYDGNNRRVQKKLPGCEPIVMKYDKADRLVFSQDGNQRSRNEWTFAFHDALGRLTVTGTWKSNLPPALDSLVVRTDHTGTGPLAGYTVNLTLPPVELMNVYYHDDHAFAAGFPLLQYAAPPAGYGTRFENAKGMMTGKRAYRLDDPAKFTLSAFYHDHRGRVVQTRSTNHLGGHELEYLEYTFTGKVKRRRTVHSAPGKTTQTETYAYDYGSPATNPAERLLAVTHELNGSTPVTLAEYTHDEVGRMKTKKLATETSTYDYNTRGW
ncbi:MAG: DUF6443 domain-containing protein, partial [Bacteroidota bacterium]|nr:DUF6443 domain-containing protein [Bacteroidota bacterium]